MSDRRTRNAELDRLIEDDLRVQNWKRWGPYLSERQWGTVREDYSRGGEAWDYLPHDHARSRAYRWGEDGLLGICDRQGRLCFALALWNERDPILKERLFGLTGPEGNHGEDVKEEYFYLDATPTHSYLSALYKYPQAEFPYAELVEENRKRGRSLPELELADTGVLQRGYFDVQAEYAKATSEDILIRITVTNRGSSPARLHVLPTLWFRNTWSWGRTGEGYWPKPNISRRKDLTLRAEHRTLGKMMLHAEARDVPPALLFTENETNVERLFGTPNGPRPVKDAFHELLVHGRTEAVSAEPHGTKAAFHSVLELAPGASEVLRLRLVSSGDDMGDPFGPGFETTFARRIEEADRLYKLRIPSQLDARERQISRQAYAGLIWTKQFYYYVVEQWREGDPAQPRPPENRDRNADWRHLYNRDVISMPDKWEYPWYAAWDLAFHMVPFARVDPYFAKEQLLLMLREWYMHPNGQIPAYEYAFSDVNPPVHAWAAWRVYKLTGRRGYRDRAFLARVFQKLLLNFTWWVNRKDEHGENLFSGGFLGLDNIGLFDRSHLGPLGAELKQADGTAWMAFYAATMLAMALELARDDLAYEDLASKFFEHFVSIVDAMNTAGGTGLWDEEDGFYYDQLHVDGNVSALKTRSMVGLVPLFAVEILEDDSINMLHGFRRRMNWFIENRQDLARHISYLDHSGGEHGHSLLAVPSKKRLERVLRYVLDENEFLSPYGIRSLSRYHKDHPNVFQLRGHEHRVDYTPGESTTGMFGGNSNWRGPIWFPLNFLLVESLERYHHFYGNDFKVECPVGSGVFMNLSEVSDELCLRLARLFLPGADGGRPCHGDDRRYADDPAYKDLVLFYEHFDGDDGRGLGASHQTGWTALVVRCLEKLANTRRSD